MEQEELEKDLLEVEAPTQPLPSTDILEDLPAVRKSLCVRTVGGSSAQQKPLKYLKTSIYNHVT